MANQPIYQNWSRKLPNSAQQCKIMAIMPFKITDFGINHIQLPISA